MCFPELDREQQHRLLVRHFESVGMTLIEMALCWWASDSRLHPLYRIEGLEHLREALDRGKGVIIAVGLALVAVVAVIVFAVTRKGEEPAPIIINNIGTQEPATGTPDVIVKDDPEQEKDLSADYADGVERLRKRVHRIAEQAGSGITAPDAEQMEQLRSLGYVQ